MTVNYNSLPQSLMEFKMLVDNGLNAPEKTASLFICAVHLLGVNFNEGLDAINILKGPQPLSNFEKQWFKDRISDKKYLAMAYFEGSAPENSYTPTTPYTINFLPDPRPQDCEQGYIRLYIKTPAFDTKRYIKMRSKGENWYIWDINSIMLGVKTRVADDLWA